MGRVHYWLFNYAKGHYRTGVGRTVEEGCQDAFGCQTSSRYKDMGTLMPKYLSQKVKKAFYSDEGWSKRA